MRLFVEIPCLDEARYLPQVLEEIPREIAGIDETKIAVIDDGSTDGTAEVARANGADYVLKNHKNLGLAASFFRGLEFCVDKGADVIVMMAGDHQEYGEDLPSIVEPIVSGRADITYGARFMEEGYYTKLKKRVHSYGSAILNLSFDTGVADPVCGFRGYSREAAVALQRGAHYFPETSVIIQSRRLNTEVVNIPVRSRPSPRKSRVVTNIGTFSYRMAADTIREALAIRERGGYGA